MSDTPFRIEVSQLAEHKGRIVGIPQASLQGVLLDCWECPPGFLAEVEHESGIALIPLQHGEWVSVLGDAPEPPPSMAPYWVMSESPAHVGLCVSAPSWWERLPVIRRFRDQHSVVIEGNSLGGKP